MALSIEERNQIVGMSMAGSSIPTIANLYNVHRATVHRIVKLYKEKGTVEKKSNPGRPRILSDRDVRAVVSVVHKNCRVALADIAHAIPTKVSKSTIRRTLHRQGIFSRTAVIEPHLTPRHKKARLDFAKKYKTLDRR